MSCKLDVSNLTTEQKKCIHENLVVPRQVTKFCNSPDPLKCFKQTDDKNTILIPMGFFNTYYQKISSDIVLANELNLKRKSYKKHTDTQFTGDLTNVQKGVKQELFQTLNDTHIALLALATGLGKTCMGVYISCKLQYKTLILCHRSILIQQWIQAIDKFTNLESKKNAQILTANNEVDESCHFYLINVTQICKRQSLDFKNIGLIICDEAHIFGTENLVQSLFKLTPKYCLGLSATPERPDKMDKILYLFFGPTIITRKNTTPFTVHQINTNIEIKGSSTANNSLNWNQVILDQSENVLRNQCIVKLACDLSDRHIIIACKRVEQCRIIHLGLLDKNQTSTLFIGSSKKFDENARILVTTFSKSSCGLDHPILDTMIIASDMKDGVEQLIGRIFRRQNVEPQIYDLVDDFWPLRKHFNQRKELYTKLGGKIEFFQGEWEMTPNHLAVDK